ncbi:M23 family metallopeptidase [Cryobacterium sp. BB736]|uniref:M23 family metallopeptidase n=1 Tax=Cryobacterium sp. BB736 TaxID=2746963 RepID=UPI001875B348
MTGLDSEFEAGAPLTRRELRNREEAARKQPSRRLTGIPKAPPSGDAFRGAKLKSKEHKESLKAQAKARAERQSAASRPPAGPKKSLKRRIASKAMSLSAAVAAGLMLVSTTIPANAFYQEPLNTAPTAQAVEIQALTVGTETKTVAVERDAYTASSLADQIRAKYGSAARNYAYAVNPAGTIQWPFPYAAPITSGFGPRGGCGYCSTYHNGLDFTPGAGTPIHSIADGTVVDISNGGSAYGVMVIVEHLVNGQSVKSMYAHMSYGSVAVALGQQIGVGTIIGTVGSTGASTGAHLHLEIHVEGVPVDPYEWLQANAN